MAPRKDKPKTGARCGSCNGTGIQTIIYQKTGKTGTRICNACNGRGTK